MVILCWSMFRAGVRQRWWGRGKEGRLKPREAGDGKIGGSGVGGSQLFLLFLAPWAVLFTCSLHGVQSSSGPGGLGWLPRGERGVG